MEKINFNQVRGFSDSITLTFNFIKQEFKPLLRSFAVIALPVIFIGLFFMSYSARESLIAIVQPDQYAGSPLDMLTNSLLTNLSTMVIYFWMALIGIAYIRVYQDKVAAADEARITPGEVWQVMWRNLGKSLLWAVIYLLMVVFGTILFIAPGVYLGVVFGFVFYYMILENRSISAGMSGSRELLKGKWWNFRSDLNCRWGISANRKIAAKQWLRRNMYFMRQLWAPYRGRSMTRRPPMK